MLKMMIDEIRIMYLSKLGQKGQDRGRGQKVGPIDRGVRRSIYVFA